MDTTESTSQTDPRLAVMERLREAVRADFVLAVRMVRTQETGRLYFDDPVFVGAPGLQQLLDGLHGRAFEITHYGIDHQATFGRFSRTKYEDQPADVQQIWDAAGGVYDSVCINLEHEGRMLGNVGAYRFRARDDPFDARALRTANRLTEDLQVAMHDSLRGVCHEPAPVHSYVVDTDGGLLYHLVGDPQPKLTERVQRAVAAFVEGTGPDTLVAEGVLLTLTRLAGGRGEAVLVHAQPTVLMPVLPIMRLTALKRRIVGHASRGATVLEIADEMQRSPETIRTHLKRIYDQLGVANRVELAELCRNLWG